MESSPARKGVKIGMLSRHVARTLEFVLHFVKGDVMVTVVTKPDYYYLSM